MTLTAETVLLTIRVFWRDEDGEYIAQDVLRPGLTALAPTIPEVLVKMAEVIELVDGDGKR